MRAQGEASAVCAQVVIPADTYHAHGATVLETLVAEYSRRSGRTRPSALAARPPARSTDSTPSYRLSTYANAAQYL